MLSILGIGNVTDVRNRLDPKGVDSIEVLTNGGPQMAIFVDEGNLYEAVGRSRKPEAKVFMSWVYREVLPMIRRTGAYFTDEKYSEIYNDPRKMGELLIKYADQIEKLRTENMIVNNLASQDAIEYDSLMEENLRLQRKVEELEDLLDEQYEEDLDEDIDY